MRQDIWDIPISFDSGLIYQHVYESFETRQEQVERVDLNELVIPETNAYFEVKDKLFFQKGIKMLERRLKGDWFIE